MSRTAICIDNSPINRFLEYFKTESDKLKKYRTIEEILDYINQEIEKLGKENFFHKAYEKTLHPTHGDAAKADDLVVEGGKVD